MHANLNYCDIILINFGGDLMKVIFLDFDGVINNWYHFDGVAIENAMILKQILLRADAKIVATTSNKYGLQRNRVVDYYSSNYYVKYVRYLNELGIKIDDMTPYVNGDRSLEIKRYLQEHSIEQFVIIDDELVDSSLQEHQVFLDLYMGLQEEHIEPALRILNGQLGFYPREYNRNETFEELLARINSYHNFLKRVR